MFRCSTFVLVLALSALPAVVPAEARPSHAPVRVTIEQGMLEGETAGRVTAFRGIPYAAPPTGAARFRGPQAPVAWTGVRMAQDFGPACPQLIDADLTENNNAVMAEDCLSLNVWTPRVDARKRPVMVWIHGGAFVVGSTRNTYYDGARLAARGDVVMVTVNYRLGAWGFLALGEFGADYAESANVGLLDQVAALRWVRDNIAKFGGDPSNVTIFGESAGASSVGALLSLPAADGLFAKAILQSGTPTTLTSQALQRSVRLAGQFLKLAGVESPAQLATKSMQDLLNAQQQLFAEHSELGTFGPQIDGVTLKETPFTVVAEGRGSRVPVLIGMNREEMRYFSTVEDLGLERKPRELLQRQLEESVGPAVTAQLLSTYGRLYPDWGDRVVQLSSDAFFLLPTVRTAEAAAAYHPVYMYLFTYQSTSTFKPFGSAHAMEIPFVFGVVDLPEVIAFTGRAPYRAALAARMMDHWAAFARHGDPSLRGEPRWQPYASHSRQTMELGPESRLVDDPLGEQRKAWGGVLPGKDVAWRLLQDNGE